MLERDEILRRTNNGLDVFVHYLGEKCRSRKNFKNPMYDDKNESFNIYPNEDGKYVMHDFGDARFHGDCFDLVAIRCGLNSNRDFKEVAKIIDKDLGLGVFDREGGAQVTPFSRSSSQFAITPQKHKEEERERKGFAYTIKTQPYRESEKSFWAQYGIDKRTLDRFNVVSIAEYSSVSREGKPYQLRSSINEPIFGYLREGYIKLYRPNSKVRFQYGGDTEKGHSFGLEQLPAKGDIVFITSGEKDVLSLSVRGFNAICFNSETIKTIPDAIINSLYHRFKHIVILFDMDKAGQASSLNLAESLTRYDVKRLELPLSGEKSEKDISDYFKIGYTRKDLLNIFALVLDKIYDSTMTMLSSCEIDYSNPPKRAEELVSVANVPLGTQGNLLGITGGEGTGKSSFVASLLSGAICSGSENIDTLGTTVLKNINHKAVLLYDTEQSEVQLYKNISNLLRRANMESTPEEFKSFSLTALSRKERMKAIIQSMDRYYYEFDGIHLVVIDGIADLVRCANDEGESIAVIEELYRLAGIYNTCIVCVLHYVPNGLKLRGHLGSEVQRKAAAILSIEKDKDPAISVIKALKVRDGSALDVPLMQFSWSKEQNMHTYIGNKSEQARIKRKRHDLSKLSEEVFSQVAHITYGDLCQMLQDLTGIGERTACDYIKDMTTEGIIVKDIHNKKYYMRGL